MTIQALSRKQVFSLIKAVGTKRTVLVEGPHGGGKTSMHYEAQNDSAFKGYHFVDPIDCTQLSDGSVWMPDIDREKGVSRELPNERFGVSRRNQKGIDSAQPCFLTLDEILKTRQFIKDTLAPIAYERRIGGYHMPEGSIVLCLTNLSIEGLGDSMQPHLRDRVIVVKMRGPTAEEWIGDFAIPRGLNASLIAFVHMFPQVMHSFLDYMPGGLFAGKDQSKDNAYIFNPKLVQDKWCTARSLHACSDILDEADSLDADTLTAALCGTVGEPTAKEMSAFVRFGQEIPAFDLVVSDPKKCPLPKNPAAQIVQVFQFVTKVDNHSQASAVVKYVTRMQNEMQTLFANAVATSSRIIQFAQAEGFGKLMDENRIYYGSK